MKKTALILFCLFFFAILLQSTVFSKTKEGERLYVLSENKERERWEYYLKIYPDKSYKLILGIYDREMIRESSHVAEGKWEQSDGTLILSPPNNVRYKNHKKSNRLYDIKKDLYFPVSGGGAVNTREFLSIFSYDRIREVKLKGEGFQFLQ